MKLEAVCKREEQTARKWRLAAGGAAQELLQLHGSQLARMSAAVADYLDSALVPVQLPRMPGAGTFLLASAAEDDARAAAATEKRASRRVGPRVWVGGAPMSVAADASRTEGGGTGTAGKALPAAPLSREQWAASWRASLGELAVRVRELRRRQQAQLQDNPAVADASLSLSTAPAEVPATARTHQRRRSSHHDAAPAPPATERGEANKDLRQRGRAAVNAAIFAGALQKQVAQKVRLLRCRRPLAPLHSQRGGLFRPPV